MTTNDTTAQPLIFYDRTRVVADWVCRRRRYYATEYGGRGLSPVTRAHALSLGIVEHELFEHAFRAHVEAGVLNTDLARALDLACAEVLPPFIESMLIVGYTADKASEQAALAEGLFRGWFASAWPDFDREYEVLAVEVECLHPHDGCMFASKPDLVLRRREDGTIWYWEWKTTGSVRPSWFKQWNYDIQFMAGALGVKDTLGLEVSGVIVQGLYKGYEREDSAGVKVQYSPFCYVYERTLGTVHGIETEYSVETERAKGWHKVGVWTTPGGVSAQIARMSADALREQFPRTPPYFINKARVAVLLKQRALRERSIARNSAELLKLSAGGSEDLARLFLDVDFPQSFNACSPVVGNPCPYRDICFVDSIGADPIASGLYEWRMPHHTTDPAYAGAVADDEEEAA